ncbi:MAG: SUMF1/EgtB/PvdO family nonheme iron enzyme [Planctomycetes bacterium]|nr:SUMF1/EgtB/PvdO family nonheme iron enzyme [Planctomycetota bacterium]
MVLIPEGSFQMGAPITDEEFKRVFGHPPGPLVSTEARPAHKVDLWSYYLGDTEVTVQQFDRFVSVTGYLTTAERSGHPRTWRAPGFQQSHLRPAVYISYEDAAAFCDWLSRKEKRTYRLPTEAEWEYACRGGTDTLFYWGDSLADAHRYANLKGAKDGYEFTSPVGVNEPNPWGLYDTIGNVWEWCADWHSPTYYRDSDSTNPRGPGSGKRRAYRGFSWMDNEPKSWFRNRQLPRAFYGNSGFRVMTEIAEFVDKEQKRLAKIRAEKERLEAEATVTKARREQQARAKAEAEQRRIAAIQMWRTVIGDPDASVGRVGEVLMVGDIAWTVKEVRDLGKTVSHRRTKKTTEGRFIYVKIQVENKRREAATMVSREVIDAQGRTYGEVAESRDLVEKSVFLFDTLQPSVPYEFEALFEVSASSNGLGLEVSNLQVDEHRSGIIALGL